MEKIVRNIAMGIVVFAVFFGLIVPVQAQADITQPASASDLKEIAVGSTWINWTWINPPDADFSHVMVYDVHGVLKTNVSGAPGEMSYLNTSSIEPFEPNKTYTICTHTVDTYGNITFQVQVRPEIFPDGFFEQRRIVEFGIPKEATEEERKRFEECEKDVRDKFLSFPGEALFFGATKAEGR